MGKSKVVISGINGFVGQHLARQLASQGVTIIGIGQDAEVAPVIKSIVDTYYAQDLTVGWPDTGPVTSIIHLAGLAAVGPSFDDPQRYITVNSSMMTHLAEYYLKQEHKPRIVAVSSGAIYDSNQPMPISEEGILGFSSPYALSKILVENQCTYYRGRGLDCVIARPFNHIGPGQSKGFILPDFYARLTETAEGPISVGNITTKRDYTDVRDIVKAYALLALAPQLHHTVYNICSGRSLAGSEIFDKLKQAMHKPDIAFEIDPALIRPTDIAEIIGDSSQLQTELGWKPAINIDQTIKDFVSASQAAA